MLTYQITLRLSVEQMDKNIDEKCGKRVRAQRAIENEPCSIDWKFINQKIGKVFSSETEFFAYQEFGAEIYFVAISQSHPLTSVWSMNEIEKVLCDAGIEVSVCEVIDFKEITLTECYHNLMMGEENDMLRVHCRNYAAWGLDAIKEQSEATRRKECYRFEEHLVTADFSTLKEAQRHLRDVMMGNSSLSSELERIYHDRNHKGFLEHPVHYFLRATSRYAAKEILDVLVGALYANGRLTSRRINYFSDFESSVKERNLRKMLDSSEYSAVAVELPANDEAVPLRPLRLVGGEFDLPRFWLEETLKRHRNTLFIFVTIVEEDYQIPHDYLRKISESIDLIILREYKRDKRELRTYLNRRAEEKGITAFEKEELEDFLTQEAYTLLQAKEIFDNLCKKRLQRKYYPSYQNANTYRTVYSKSTKSIFPSMDKMSHLVGLKDIKEMVNRIVAVNKMQKLRADMKIKSTRQPLHMVFVGNPGSAKTTVARLLAEILQEEDILSTGAFIECGRSDLVGKYVGWTAKIVKQKFQEAMGGILFIDEAYSLVDGSNSFGAEAVNTIVQEMENHREDILVIFAGYPDKMEEFIESNDGLRSRIAFHVKFPDYKVKELEDILCVMAKERGYRLNQGILKKCRSIFQNATKEENFGNGRYVRNLLDAAIMRQAERIMTDSSKEKITRQKAICLTMADFEPVKVSCVKPKTQVGFQVLFANDNASNE